MPTEGSAGPWAGRAGRVPWAGVACPRAGRAWCAAWRPGFPRRCGPRDHYPRSAGVEGPARARNPCYCRRGGAPTRKSTGAEAITGVGAEAVAGSAAANPG